jgi:hypothetical protein
MKRFLVNVILILCGLPVLIIMSVLFFWHLLCSPIAHILDDSFRPYKFVERADELFGYMIRKLFL